MIFFKSAELTRLIYLVKKREIFKKWIANMQKLTTTITNIEQNYIHYNNVSTSFNKIN